MRALALLVLITACGSAPAPVSPAKPPPPALPKVVEAPEPEPPPEPLAFQDVAFDQKWAFASSGLGSLSPRLMPESDLVKRLPANLAASYRSVERARDAHAKAARNAYKSKAHRDAASRTRKAFYTTLDRATQALEKQLDKKATGAVGIALARLRLLATDAGALALARSRIVQTDTASPALDRVMRYGSIEEDSDSTVAIEPLERAVAVSGLDEVGRWARIELVHHLMSTDRAREAKAILSELLPVTPPDQTPQLHYRIGLLHGLDGADEEAASTFRSAHTELAVTSGITRLTLIQAELLARHRARQFDRVLSLSAEAWDEERTPAPVKPDPNPPPPPPPPKKGAPVANVFGLIGMLNQGTYGILRGFESSIGEREMLQLATDAVERLNREPDKLDGPPGLRAGIVSRLATRALYRGDLERAKAYGNAARELDEAGALDGIRVLRVLAARAGDRARVSELDKQIATLRYRTQQGHGVEHDFLLAETRREARDPKTDPKQSAPEVERNVRSLLRLCLEPVHHLLPEAKVHDQTVAEIELSARVYPDGRVEVENGETAQGALAEVSRCARQLGPRIFAHAASSVRARVALKSMRAPRGGLWGDAIGDSFGYGGLGGLGGLGTGSGFGGIGTRGSGVIGGGTGRLGAGGLGGLGTKGVPKKKPAQLPKKQP